MAADAIEILNTTQPLPFPPLMVPKGVDEALRLRYRYLDLRRLRCGSFLLKIIG